MTWRSVIATQRRMGLCHRFINMFVPVTCSPGAYPRSSHVSRVHPRAFQGLRLNERPRAAVSHARNFDSLTASPHMAHQRVLTLRLDRRSLGNSRRKRGTSRHASWLSVCRRLTVNYYRKLLPRWHASSRSKYFSCVSPALCRINHPTRSL